MVDVLQDVALGGSVGELCFVWVVGWVVEKIEMSYWSLWMNGWEEGGAVLLYVHVGGWVEERDWTVYMDGWVGGWVGELTWLRRMRASFRSVFIACSSREPLNRTSMTFPKDPFPRTWGSGWVGGWDGMGGLGGGERGGSNEVLWVSDGWVGGWVGRTFKRSKSLIETARPPT